MLVKKLIKCVNSIKCVVSIGNFYLNFLSTFLVKPNMNGKSIYHPALEPIIQFQYKRGTNQSTFLCAQSFKYS